MAVKVLYVIKFKGETLDAALRKCGGLKQCFRSFETAIESAKHASFNLKNITIIKIQYEKIELINR